MHGGLLAALERHHDQVVVFDHHGRVVRGVTGHLTGGLFSQLPVVGGDLLDSLVAHLREPFAAAFERVRSEGRAEFKLEVGVPSRLFAVELAESGEGEFVALIDAIGIPDPLRRSTSDDPSDFLQDTLSRLTQGVIIYGPQAEALMANQAALDLFGMSEAQLLGRTPYDPRWFQFHADEKPVDNADLPVPVSIREREAVRGVTLRLDRPHGLGRVWLQMDALPVFGADGEISHVVCSCVDISSERETHAKLEREHAILSEVLYTSVTGITVLDRSGVIVFANRAAEEITGLSGSELVGRSYDDPAWRVTDLDGGPLPLESRPVGRILATKRPILDVRFLLELDDGTHRAVSVNGAPVIDRNGDVERLVIAFFDITQQVNEAAEREHLQREMESLARLESLSVLAGGVAHDFNNILVGVMTSAELIRDELPSDHPAQGLASIVEQGGQRAAELTRQLMTFSGRGSFDLEPTDLSACIRETSQLLQALVSKDVCFELDLAEGLPAIDADPLQIRQIAMNAVLNASQALDGRPGTIALRTSAVDAGGSFDVPDGHLVEGDVQPPFAMIEIVDDGPGMAPEVLGRIFEPFFTTKQDGHGLGLAAARGVVRSFGGFLHVESELGGGTAFRFGFPPSPKQAPVGSESPAASAPELSGTILVIDDELVVRRVIATILSDYGCEVITAIDGVHGIETFEREFDRITAAVVDVNMPRMSGDKVIRRLRERAPGLPILLISGRLDHEFEPIDELQGFMAKPFKRAELADALGRVVRRATVGANG